MIISFVCQCLLVYRLGTWGGTWVCPNIFPSHVKDIKNVNLLQVCRSQMQSNYRQMHNFQSQIKELCWPLTGAAHTLHSLGLPDKGSCKSNQRACRLTTKRGLSLGYWTSPKQVYPFILILILNNVYLMVLRARNAQKRYFCVCILRQSHNYSRNFGVPYANTRTQTA